MESSFKPPPNLVFDQQLNKNFEKFKNAFDIYMEASGLSTAEEKRKIAIFLNVAGEEAQEVYTTLGLTNEQKAKYDEVIKAFQEYCKPRNNETYDRFKFFSRNKNTEETYDSFIKDLKVLAKPCNFGDQEDSLIRDRLILGITDVVLQERLLRQTKLTLKDAEQHCRLTEVTRRQVEGLKEEHAKVDIIRKGKRDQLAATGGKTTKTPGNTYDCRKCGRNHQIAQCFAYGQTCHNCNGLNHFAIGCKFKNWNKNKFMHGKNVSSKKNKINNLEVAGVEDDDDDDDCYIDLISLDKIGCESSIKLWKENVTINGIKISFKLDTGAQCNVLPLKWLEKVQKQKELKEINQTIITYGNNRIKVKGYVILNCKLRNTEYKLKFIVVDVESDPILGLNACVKLNLVARLDSVSQLKENGSNGRDPKEKLKFAFINENKNLFEGLGKIPMEHRIKLKNNYVPFVSVCRRVPDSLKEKLKTTLEELVQKGIIEKVEGPSEWVNNIVIIEKPNGKLRICLDPQQLNKNICLEQYPIPTIDEIGVKLKNKRVFSVVDMKDGFYQIPIDKESSNLCTFISPFGKFKFLRLPFGLSISPEVFQKINEKIFQNLGIGIYFDDCIIAGRDEKEHDELMNKFIERAKQYNIKFNPDKLQYKVSKVKYLGQEFSHEGVKPDPDYIEAITCLSEPSNKKDLLKILGMVNYLSKFVPKLSELCGPLRKLIKNDVEFIWGNEQRETFNKLKLSIINIPTLKIFDSKEPIVVQTDASQYGMGGALLQGGKPVAFCSRSLTETETRYAQIEKEYLAICYSLNKFHQFIYGKRITVNSDHKPLVAIQEKDINKITSRLQRMRLKTLKYNFKIEYLPGKQMFIADLLSRFYINKNTMDDPEMLEVVHCVEMELPISRDRLEEIINKTETDHTLKIVKQFCESGWPNHKSQFNNEYVYTDT
uniref:RNA-directed DNA polymerase n=1 Tax=Photinus pyralis TaxID=7054 RepID=A0A1Y1JV53_PHOPY